jgi:uncharacterized membrane protein
MDSITRGSSLLLIAALAGTCLAQPRYQYVEIPLPPGAVRAYATNVNEQGNVVGVGVRSDSMKIAFFYERSTRTTHVIGEIGKNAAGYEIGVHGLNDNNEAVGLMAFGSGLPHPFYWAPGESISSFLYHPTTPPISGSVYGMAWAINNRGEVAGTNIWNCDIQPTFGVLAAVKWPAIDEDPFPVIGTSLQCGVDGMLYSINNVGAMAGKCFATSGQQYDRPVVITNSGRVDLPTFGGTNQEHGAAFFVNDAGLVCGWSENRTSSGPVNGACYWEGTTVHRLDGIPAAGLAQAFSMNNFLDIVGQAYTPHLRAVLWDNLGPAAIDLNTVAFGIPSGQILTVAEDISDSGYIVGGTNQTSAQRAFILEPCDPVIVASFGNEDFNAGDTAMLEIDAGGAGPLEYEWYHNFQRVFDGTSHGGSVISGADGPILTIDGIVPSDAGRYEVLIKSTCGFVTSDAAIIQVFTCPSDFDESGFVDADDFNAFVAAFEEGGTPADYDGSGFVDLEDYIEFIEDFEVGC